MTKPLPRLRDSLLSLDAYARARHDFRKEVLAHKRKRTLHLGENLTLSFEDELTIRYQIQENLSIEKRVKESAIEDELAAAARLIPSGRNFKASAWIHHADAALHRERLPVLHGIERKIWLQVEDTAKVFAIVDADIHQQSESNAATAHFLRFELSREMAELLKYGVSLAIGVDHPSYRAVVNPIPTVTRNALVRDLK